MTVRQPWLSYVLYAVRCHRWPSRLQRLYMRGDPYQEIRQEEENGN